jgi:activator of HSP90 ATPase
MAKVGEGDPRWVVQSREDGKNVNNWHWSETDCLAWAKKHITSLLSDLVLIEDTNTSCKTKKVQSVSGECTANVRKGKTIFFYELEVKVPWEAQVDNNETIKGLLTLPYISEENDDDKMEVKVSSDSSSPESDRVSTLIKAKGIPVVQRKVAEFLRALREEFTAKTNIQPTPQPLPPLEQKKTPIETTKPAKSSSSSIRIKTIKLKEEFKGAVQDVYRSMTDPQMLNAIMQGTASMNPTEGGTFSLLGGTITGENIKLVPNSKIVQKWRFSSWPSGHFSTVTMDFTEEDGNTVLILTQESIPEDDVEKTQEGWRRNIWGRAKVMFGFGSIPF